MCRPDQVARLPKLTTRWAYVSLAPGRVVSKNGALPGRLQGSQRGFALLARKPPESAVIFVHGFDGNPTTTWVDFEHLIEELDEQRARWSRWDLFFYGYRSHNQITPLGEDLARFIEDVETRNERALVRIEFALPSSSEKMYGSSLRLSLGRGTEPYKDLFLVGHSAGAVIIREAVRVLVKDLTAFADHQGTTAWVGPALPRGESGFRNALVARAVLRFFAPAHLGVMAAGLLGAASSLPRIGKVLDAYLRYNPLYQNLRPGSPTLVDLRKETETLYEKHAIPALKALSVFGEKEDVVFIGGYSHDEQLPTEKGQNHTSICKPKREYIMPLEFVTHASAIAKRV